MTNNARNIFGLTRPEIGEALQALELPAFRAEQIYTWLYRHRVQSFDEMLNLPKALRTELAERFVLRHPAIVRTSVSRDGTEKYLVEVDGGQHVEAVLIPAASTDDGRAAKRLTLCVSTQVGCPLDCRFCATGSMAFKKNLSPGEIIGQYFAVQALHDERITNIVYMGMGEPLLNYDSVMTSVDLITDETNEGIGASRITISTAGIVPAIKRMADEGRSAKLAISLHSPDEAVRTQLMPITAKYTLRQLMDAVENYYKATGKPVTYEYVMFDALNDSDEDIRRLVKIARRIPSKVNIIAFHSIDSAYPDGVPLDLKPSPPERMEAFAAGLRKAGVTVMFRSSSGHDIDAACGQLALRSANEKKSAHREPMLN